MPKGNRTTNRTASHAARAVNHAAKIAAAGQWLDEADPDLFNAETRRGFLKNISAWRVILKIYATEYATLTGTHKRTAQRHLLAALKQGK
jgi:hypothetical protein